MWHEQRKEERRIGGMLVDRKNRAERRRDYYEETKGDPNQFLQVHGRSLHVHLEPSVALAADNPVNMIPWSGDPKIIIDRFDARANLDFIPECSSKTGPSKEESREMGQVNYERYRILVQNEFLSIGEEKFLETIDLEEKFGGKTYQGNRSKDQKKKSANKAAIGFIYPDSAPVGSGPDSDSDLSSDSEVNFDLSVNVISLGTAQQQEINRIGARFEIGKKDFVKYLEIEMEEVKMAKDKSNIIGRRSRRQRKYSPPRCAVKELSNSKSRSRSKSTESKSDIGEGKVEFITSFGGDSDQEIKEVTPTDTSKCQSRNHSKSTESESDTGEGKVEFITSFEGDSDQEVKKDIPTVSKSRESGEYIKPIGPLLPRRRSRSRKRSRHSRSRSKKRFRRSKSRRRSRYRGRRRTTSSKERFRRRFSRRSRSRSSSARRSSSKSKERERIKKRLSKAFISSPKLSLAVKRKKIKSSSSSSDSSDSGNEGPVTNRYRSKYRNRRANSSSFESEDA